MRIVLFRSFCLVVFFHLFGGMSPLAYGYENLFMHFPSLEELHAVKISFFC